MDCSFLQISKKKISVRNRNNGQQHSKNSVTKNTTLPLLEPQSVHVHGAKLDSVLPHLSKSQQKTQQHGAPLHQVREQFGQAFCKHNGDSQQKQKMDKEKAFVRQPMSPAHVLQVYKKYLTEFEQEEIKGYKQVWYLGHGAEKIRGTQSLSCNSGYDTEDGYYRTVIRDHIAYRFEVLAAIGEGSFSQVLKCRDRKTMELVAIKVVRNQERLTCEAMAEVKILDALRKKDRTNTVNILHMKEYFHFRGHLCISFQLLGKDLYSTLEENNFHGFSTSQVRQYAVDLLTCLQLLKKEGIIHCDLKPENILLSGEGHEHVKVIDFGASCFEKSRCYPCVQTLLYMSPEVLLSRQYSTAIDMWSLGCILAELHTGCPLFAGIDMNDQFNCIMEVLGVPPEELLKNVPSKKKFFSSPRNMVNREGKMRLPGSKNLARLLNTKDINFIDFIQRCLRYNPEERMTPEEAMQHAWIQEQLQHNSRAKALATDKITSGATAHFSKESGLLKRQKMAPVRLQPIGGKKVPEVKANSSTAGMGKYSVQNRTTQTLQTRKERERVTNSTREHFHFPVVRTGKEQKGRIGRT